MLLKFSAPVFLAAIFSLALGNITHQQSAIDLGRVLIFLSVVFVLVSMITITVKDVSNSILHDQPKANAA